MTQSITHRNPKIVRAETQNTCRKTQIKILKHKSSLYVISIFVFRNTNAICLCQLLLLLRNVFAFWNMDLCFARHPGQRICLLKYWFSFSKTYLDFGYNPDTCFKTQMHYDDITCSSLAKHICVLKYGFVFCKTS